jgi:hypothetical protein
MARLQLTRNSKLAFPGGFPGYNKDHPASRLAFNSFVASSAGLVNLVNGQPGTVVGSPTFAVKDIGPAVNTPASAGYQFTSVPANPGTGTTLAAIIKTDSSISGFGWALYLDASPAIALAIYTSAFQVAFNGSGYDLSAFGAPATNTSYFIAVSFVDAGGGNVAYSAVLKNLKTGRILSTGPLTQVDNISAGQTSFFIGSNNGSTSSLLNFAAGMGSYAYLTNNQLLQWADDPWAFWYPRKVDLASYLVSPQQAAATLVTGWDYIQDDVYPKLARPMSAAPAFVSPFRTAGIAGISWSGPRDHAKLPPSVVFSAPPAFGRSPTTPVPISGMAWFEPKENDKLPKGGFLTDPVAVTYIPQTITWAFSVGDTTFLREPPMDTPPGYGRTPFAQPVGISGMAWFEPPDRDKPATKIRIESPPAIQLIPGTLPTPVSGIGWFEPPDRDKRAIKINGEAPPAISLTPGTLPVPIRGMAWFEPLPNIVRLSIVYSSDAPALQQPIVDAPPSVTTEIHFLPFIMSPGQMSAR